MARNIEFDNWFDADAQGEADAARAFPDKASASNDAEPYVQLMPRSFEGIVSQFEEDLGLGSWMVSSLTGDVFWSIGTYRIHDVTPGTPIGLEAAFSYFAPEDEQRIRDIVDEARQRGKDYVFEATLISDAGRRKRVRSHGRSVDHDGVPLLMGVIRLIENDAS